MDNFIHLNLIEKSQKINIYSVHFKKKKLSHIILILNLNKCSLHIK